MARSGTLQKLIKFQDWSKTTRKESNVSCGFWMILQFFSSKWENIELLCFNLDKWCQLHQFIIRCYNSTFLKAYKQDLYIRWRPCSNIFIGRINDCFNILDSSQKKKAQFWTQKWLQCDGCWATRFGLKKTKKKKKTWLVPWGSVHELHLGWFWSLMIVMILLEKYWNGWIPSYGES